MPKVEEEVTPPVVKAKKTTKKKAVKKAAGGAAKAAKPAAVAKVAGTKKRKALSDGGAAEPKALKKKKKKAPAAAEEEAAEAPKKKKKKTVAKKAPVEAAPAAAAPKAAAKKTTKKKKKAVAEAVEEVAAPAAAKKAPKKKGTKKKEAKAAPTAKAAADDMDEDDGSDNETEYKHISVSSFEPSDLAAPAAKTKKALRVKRREHRDERREEEDIQLEASTAGKGHGKSAAVEVDTANRGVLYVGHIPHGFYEKEMTAYFGQFGIVTRLRLARNKKTGASRHFAFVEFKDLEVAMIVQDTMDGYLLDNKLLVVKLVDQEKLHPDTFKGAEKTFKKIPWRELAMKRHNQDRTAAQQQKRLSSLSKRDKKKRQQLEKAGIEYDFPGYGDAKDATSTHITF